MDIQEAIKWYQAKLAVNDRFSLHGNQDEAAKLALLALQEQAEREKGCPVCNKGVKIIYSPEDDLYPYAAEFCPHCGRRLK